MKMVTIPKLELMAADLLAKQMAKVCDDVQLPNDIKTLVEWTRVAITMSRRLAQDGPSWQKRHIRSKTSCGSDNNTQTGTMEPLVEIFQLQSFGKDRRQNLESHREDEE